MSKLARAGKILAIGFGDRVAIGIFLSFLEEVTPEEAYDYIKNNHSRVDEISEENWQNFGQQARELNFTFPDVERVLTALKKHHIDLASIIINTPNGYAWLESEIQKAKEKLGF